MDSDHPAAYLERFCFNANDLCIINYSLFFASLQWITWVIPWGTIGVFIMVCNALVSGEVGSG
jgi:hypothetical protein